MEGEKQEHLVLRAVLEKVEGRQHNNRIPYKRVGGSVRGKRHESMYENLAPSRSRKRDLARKMKLIQARRTTTSSSENNREGAAKARNKHTTVNML